MACMRDCSANAMAPKEQPKTCGTCGHADPYALSCDICCKSRRFQVGYDEKDCGYWVEDADTLEQRYQQLEHVAQGMLSFIERVEQTAYEEFREQLKEIGVSVDD